MPGVDKQKGAGDTTGETAPYWEPRVMHHRSRDGASTYAIHEVYFSAEGKVDGWTEDALSPREPTLDALRESLLCLLSRPETTPGDLGYTYGKEYIEEWVECLDAPVIEGNAPSP